MPLPMGNQAEPSQRAILLAVTPPADVTEPPAISSPLGITVSAATELSKAPSGDHAEPFQLAAPTYPPAVKSPLGMMARADTVELTPDPRDDHADPSQRATWFADRPPAVLKCPPAIKSPLAMTAKA